MYVVGYIFGIAILLALVALGVFVYTDAPKYGMDRGLWVLIVIFVPNLMGLIIYLIVRSERKQRCINCDKRIDKTLETCNYCRDDRPYKRSNQADEISEKMIGMPPGF